MILQILNKTLKFSPFNYLVQKFFGKVHFETKPDKVFTFNST